MIQKISTQEICKGHGKLRVRRTGSSQSDMMIIYNLATITKKIVDNVYTDDLSFIKCFTNTTQLCLNEQTFFGTLFTALGRPLGWPMYLNKIQAQLDFHTCTVFAFTHDWGLRNHRWEIFVSLPAAIYKEEKNF